MQYETIPKLINSKIYNCSFKGYTGPTFLVFEFVSLKKFFNSVSLKFFNSFLQLYSYTVYCIESDVDFYKAVPV